MSRFYCSYNIPCRLCWNSLK